MRGYELYGRVIDMEKSKPIFKSTREARIVARKRLTETEQRRGSQEQYYEHLLEQFNAFDDTRRRANIVD